MGQIKNIIESMVPMRLTFRIVQPKVINKIGERYMADYQKESGSALQKATLVLDTLLQSKRPENLADISSKLDLPRQTVHRVFRQLKDLNLVRRDLAREHYYVGARMIHLSLKALRSAARLAPIRSTLRKLVSDIGETCNVGIMERDEIVYIDRVGCDWPLRLQLSAGSRIPIHASAIGKLLLAHLPCRTRRRILDSISMLKFMQNTMTEIDDLELEFKQIRRKGYAVNNEENLKGLVDLAVPIYDRDGRAVAGLAVHAPVARMTLQDAAEKLPNMRAVAGKLQHEVFEPQSTGDSSYQPTNVGMSIVD